MKKLYIMILCGLACAGSADAATRFAAKQSGHKANLVQKSPEKSSWRPATQTDYIYMDGEWIELGTVKFTYDSRGNAILELMESEGVFMKTEKSYDEYDNLVSSVKYFSEDGVSWVEESKMSYKYDSVLHDYYIERMGYDWDGEKWMQNYYCETNAITRDSKGNITEIIKSLPLGEDTMLPAYKLSWGYDEASGQANTMVYYANMTDGTDENWVVDEDIEYHNILWESTDGQMTDADISTYTEGNNKISSCDVIYEGDMDGHIFVTYDGKGGFTAKETFLNPEEIGVLSTKTMIDPYGSFCIETSEYLDEDGLYSPTPTYISRYVVYFDNYGNVRLEEISDLIDDEYAVVDGYAYDYTYSSDGNVMEFVSNIFDYEIMDYVPDYKIVYGEYLDVSGVQEITDVEAPVEFYDLQGRRVNNPDKGIYIKRVGNKVSKVLK